MTAFETLIIEKLNIIEKSISTSEYLTRKEAAKFMGIKNERKLKTLITEGVLKECPRGERMMFKKSNCTKVAEMIDSKQIKI